ncbi:P-loop containing nucleoside triphosphate hydrolase protein [Stachybotrys elegans]|uniref:P-loop containing nucleoside triphosphate hydrolase protein n=1 Tax=Stachybotrys elegans TaxID=80388 RepID=A0A8K0SE02_9HYPO|nr:P-loop containing nucleoside triphosphate hydrolase protein [Stachybotrys elegans]
MHVPDDEDCEALQAAVPLHSFPSQELYVERFESGTLIEMMNETKEISKFNEAHWIFQSWVIGEIPGLTTAFAKTWLVLVNEKPERDPDHATIPFPAIGDAFSVDFDASITRDEQKYTLVCLRASRIPNPYHALGSSAGCEMAAKLAAFEVSVPRSWQNDEGDHVELDLVSEWKVTSSIDCVPNGLLSASSSQGLFIKLSAASTTYEAELAALRTFIEGTGRRNGPGDKSMRAFEMLQDFRVGWKTFYDLHDAFPHLKDPEKAKHRIPKILIDKFRSFTPDHRAAFDGLARIPNGIYFVNGCPGAGKTEWNMVVAALIQAKGRPGVRRKRSPILFLVDINQAVDEAANRYYKLCEDAGIQARIIRMHGWPYEMRHSERMNATEADIQGATDEAVPEFTRKFLETSSLARHAQSPTSNSKAPSLDEAAWRYYERHKDDCFKDLSKILSRMDAGEVLTTPDWKSLRGMVSCLYKAVLAQADFVATTPVATYGSFSKLFRPDVVFMDEAPHARELTSLIPLAFFDPLAWIFTGDVNQTRPFVKSGSRASAIRDGMRWNPFAKQLQYSMMARAATIGAINGKLLVNKRAFGNLHQLPSKMFYQGQMVSGNEASDSVLSKCSDVHHDHLSPSMYPASTIYLKGWLEGLLGNGVQIASNRILVHLESKEEESQRSFWNPTHFQWMTQHVKALLHDTNFRNLSGDGPGSVMLQTPYSMAVRQYHAEVQTWPKHLQERLQVVTVDKAQGNQADVVFLDTVRTTGPGFMDDPQRLNVAITRARQAEVIVMHPGMTRRKRSGRMVRTEYTSQLWEDAVAENSILCLHEQQTGVP